MKNVKIIQLTIVFDRLLQFSPNIGAVTLSRGGREYILDVCYSETYGEPDCGEATEIICKLEVDKEIFEDCKYDLTQEDLLSEDLLALFFVESDEEEFEIESIKLEFEIDGERKSIDAHNEMEYEESTVTAMDVLNWHGSDHSIEELAQVLADVVNGKYNFVLCREEILNLKG